MAEKKKYFVLHKPYGYLSQFTREVPDHKVLGDLYNFPQDVYPVGRLDKDSEGLLVLTNDKALNHKLLDPKFKHERTYWVQVEGRPTEAALNKLRNGITINVKKQHYKSLPAKAQIIADPELEERDPPVRHRVNIPTTWVQMSLIEGKNRQVRRMCAAVGFPVLRLVRVKIKGLKLDQLKRGAVRELHGNSARQLLFLG